MKSEQKKLKKKSALKKILTNKKLIKISNEKTNLEKQVITLKHLNMQLKKQLMSSKERWISDLKTR